MEQLTKDPPPGLTAPLQRDKDGRVVNANGEYLAVICIDPSGWPDHLTLGKVYETCDLKIRPPITRWAGALDGQVVVLTDQGYRLEFGLRRFGILDGPPESGNDMMNGWGI